MKGSFKTLQSQSLELVFLKFFHAAIQASPSDRSQSFLQLLLQSFVAVGGMGLNVFLQIGDQPFQQVQLVAVWRQIEESYVFVLHFSFPHDHDLLAEMQMILHVHNNNFGFGRISVKLLDKFPQEEAELLLVHHVVFDFIFEQTIS